MDTPKKTSWKAFLLAREKCSPEKEAKSMQSSVRTFRGHLAVNLLNPRRIDFALLTSLLPTKGRDLATSPKARS